VNIRVTSFEPEPGDRDVIPFAGDLDAHTAPMLQKAVDRTLAAAPARVLIIDLSEVSFIDSSGLSVIVGAHKRLSDAGAGVRLVVGSPQVTKVLGLTGLDAVIPIFSSVADARLG
jgi:anti-sigma B factor antagonist